ncbi:MAG: integrase core domain-containing protein, partial [Alphaproteobacteria bacterium]
PGSPWENGYNERFNGTLRNEVLNAEWFHTVHQAQTVINVWLRQYNHIRPHYALTIKMDQSDKADHTATYFHQMPSC